ncbi:MAG: hypothetical protein DRO11_08225 [Methanobacteriota archaeon]|nr:MAG: hypothetical protein DRO11_08225 [Euryarchaeota archaeon]
MLSKIVSGDLAVAATTVIAVLGAAYRAGRWTKKWDERMRVMSGKVTATANMVYALISILAEKRVITAEHVAKLHVGYEDGVSRFEAEASNPITPEKARRRKELSVKLEENTITLDEAKELKEILEEEVEEARKEGAIAAMFATFFLLGLVWLSCCSVETLRTILILDG